MPETISELEKEKRELERESEHSTFHFWFLVVLVGLTWLEVFRSGDPWRGLWAFSVILLVTAGLIAMQRSERKRKLAYTQKLIEMKEAEN